MVGAADQFAAGQRLLQDGDSVRGQAGSHQGAAKRDLGRDGTRMIGPEHAGPAVEDPLEHRRRLGRLPGGHQRLAQAAGNHERFQSVRTEDPLAVRGELAPVGDGRAGQPRAVHALPGQHQQRVTAALGPQHVPGGLAQADGTGAQVGGQPRPRLVPGPHLEQRVRGGPGRPVIEVVGHRRADSRLGHRADPDRRRSAGRVDRQQPRLPEASDRVPGPLRVGRPCSGIPAGAVPREVIAGRRRGEHGAWYPVPVEQRGQRHQRPDAHARRQVFGVLSRERPGDRGGRRLGPARLRELLLTLHEVLPVVAAGHARAGDHRARLGERERLAAEVAHQVDRPAALVRVRAEAAGQVAHRLPGAEGRHRQRQRPALGG